MYFAHFESGQNGFVTAALGWTVKGSLAPQSWSRHLLAQTELDVALRITSDGEQLRAALLLSGDANREKSLRTCCEALLSSAKPSELVIPGDAAQFDALTTSLSTAQMRVNHDCYHHRGVPLACDFRLYTAFASNCGHLPATYQVNLRPHQPDSETERQALKQLAWLELEKPFSAPVRTMQEVLIQRWRHPAWLSDEYLVANDCAELEHWLAKIREHFSQTTGRIGFSEAPLETGDFTDWLATGCHTERYGDGERTLPSRAASVFSKEEFEWLLSADLVLDATPSIMAGVRAAGPEVFISYASGDFAHAASFCHSLEEKGLACWIAPRDIERGTLPYPEAIQQGLSQVKAVVVMVSETANLSIHIPRELDIALERKLVIVPVRLANVVPSGQLNYLLRTCQWLNAFDRPREDVVRELLSRLQTLVS
jgi:hypothetical protein